MASTPATPPAVLVPISVLWDTRRLDMAVPSVVPLVELLPGMAQAHGRLNGDSATQGFRVMTASGRELDQAKTLQQLGVSAGAFLTLVPGGSVPDVRYDDLVEAIGDAVDSVRVPWVRSDSVQLSCYTAAGLFAVVAMLLALGGGDSWLAGATGLVGAALVALAVVVLVRIPVLSGALALALTVPVLCGAAAYSLTASFPHGVRLAAAGAGLLLGAAGLVPLPPRQRAAMAAPLTAGFAVLLLGSLTAFGHASEQRASALVVAVLTVVVLLAPWIGLAQIPARIDALASSSQASVDASAVDPQVAAADVVALSLRVASGIVTVALTPLVAISTTGGLLMVSVGLGLLLGTRALYGRAEVFVNAVAGMLTLLVAGITLALMTPALLPWIVGLMTVVGAFVLAFNVLDVTLRPWLGRLSDAVHIVALTAVLPLTAMIWGIA